MRRDADQKREDDKGESGVREKLEFAEIRDQAALHCARKKRNGGDFDDRMKEPQDDKGYGQDVDDGAEDGVAESAAR